LQNYILADLAALFY